MVVELVDRVLLCTLEKYKQDGSSSHFGCTILIPLVPRRLMYHVHIATIKDYCNDDLYSSIPSPTFWIPLNYWVSL